MHKNQRGFSIVEVIIIVVVIGVLGGAGWYISNVRKSTDSAKESISESSETTPVTTETAETAKDTSVSEAVEFMKLLESNGITVSASAKPSDWKTKQCPDNLNTVFILPPTMDDVRCNSDASGFYSVSVQSKAINTDAPSNCDGAAAKRASYEAEDWFESYDCELITVDGVAGVKETTVENEQSMLGASTVYNYTFNVNASYFVISGFVYSSEVSNAAYVPMFHNFVKSFQF